MKTSQLLRKILDDTTESRTITARGKDNIRRFIQAVAPLVAEREVPDFPNFTSEMFVNVFMLSAIGETTTAANRLIFATYINTLPGTVMVDDKFTK